MPSDVDLDATLLGVVAHGVLAALAPVTEALSYLHEAWRDVDAAERRTLLAKAERHSLHVGAVLGDLVRGLPAAVVDQLDHLRD